LLVIVVVIIIICCGMQLALTATRIEIEYYRIEGQDI
jgi:cytochrome c-type biogenesis protein CcmE